MPITWNRDGIDHGWYRADGVGSIRNAASYRPGGWWFLPVWLPDTAEHDVGPFKTMKAAFAEAERMVAARENA